MARISRWARIAAVAAVGLVTFGARPQAAGGKAGIPVVTTNSGSNLYKEFGAFTHIGQDEEIAPYLTSAHIACGFHASDPATIRRTVELLRRHSVAIGAHPGYQDLIGFGRHKIDLTPQEVDDLVLYQVAAVRGMGEAFGGRLQHVKPHGALQHGDSIFVRKRIAWQRDTAEVKVVCLFILRMRAGFS